MININTIGHLTPLFKQKLIDDKILDQRFLFLAGPRVPNNATVSPKNDLKKNKSPDKGINRIIR